MASTDVTITGASTQFTTDPTDQGQTVECRSMQSTDLNPRNGDSSFFQEVTMFIGRTANAQGLSYLACVERLHKMLGQMLAFRQGG